MKVHSVKNIGSFVSASLLSASLGLIGSISAVLFISTDSFAADAQADEQEAEIPSAAESQPTSPPEPIAQSSIVPAAPVNTGTSSYVGARVDCLHNFNRNKGATQNCLAVSGLRLGLIHELSPISRAHLRLDPFAAPSASMESTPIREALPSGKDSAFGIVDLYSVIWSPRPNLEIGVESYGGATSIPAISGLTLLDAMTDEGWKQTAVTLTYHLASTNGMRVRFAMGNGEGENGKNLDPQQYFGFEVRVPIIQGLAFVGGLSFDGNSSGSERFEYEQSIAGCGVPVGTVKPTSGYSAQRFGGGLVADGTSKLATGFKFGLGWQKSNLVDLQKSKNSYPMAADLSTCEQLNPSEVFVESSSLDKANIVQRTTGAVNTSYSFAQSWFIGADIRQRKLDVGDVNLFQACSSFSGSDCSVDGSPTHLLKQTAWTVGGGKELSPGLILDFGYSKVAYDKKYSKFNYLGKNNKSTDALEAFNTRVAYNWR